MMQSAAVLPTESPVKSLPEILGVPLQRKTFSSCFSVDDQPGNWLASVNLRCRSLLRRTGDLDCHVQAGDVSCCLCFSVQKDVLSMMILFHGLKAKQ